MLFLSPYEAKTQKLFFTIFYCFNRTSVKFWYKFDFYRCYGNKKGHQNSCADSLFLKCRSPKPQIWSKMAISLLYVIFCYNSNGISEINTRHLHLGYSSYKLFFAEICETLLSVFGFRVGGGGGGGG